MQKRRISTFVNDCQQFRGSQLAFHEYCVDISMSKIKNFKLRINLSDPAELLRSFFKVFSTLYIRVLQNNQKFSKISKLFTPHLDHPNDHPRQFKYHQDAFSRPRVRVANIAEIAY